MYLCYCETTIEVMAWIHNYISLFYMDMIIYSSPNLNWAGFANPFSNKDSSGQYL